MFHILVTPYENCKTCNRTFQVTSGFLDVNRFVYKKTVHKPFLTGKHQNGKFIPQALI